MDTRSSLARIVAVVAVGVTALTACGSSSSGSAAGSGSGTVRVTKAWARDTAPKQTNDAVYLTVVNDTDHRVTITGARVPTSVAMEAQLHKTVTDTGSSDASNMDHDMTTMSEVASVAVPAHGSFRFAPGHHHIMLMDLAGALKAHQTFPITLVRGDGATVKARVTVRGV